jgi:translation initiation factor 1 (eIF-1/SUI1)
MQGQVGILRERRNGRWVVSLNFDSTHGGNLNDVASQLKKSLSVGGSLKSEVLLLQGDIREKVEQHLDRMGLTHKRTGG